MKIYTKRGDAGVTDLYDGSRAEKSDSIFNALGSIDELSSHIGMLILHIRQYSMDDHTITFLRNVQQDLLNIGSIIATPNPKEDQRLPEITEDHVKKIETSIDNIDTVLKPLTVFIKVGGVNIIESQAHICRTVCRRAERDIVGCHNDGSCLNKYMNRLSDYFFTFARFKS